jgi:hypothetical protein
VADEDLEGLRVEVGADFAALLKQEEGRQLMFPRSLRGERRTAALGRFISGGGSAHGTRMVRAPYIVEPTTEVRIVPWRNAREVWRRWFAKRRGHEPTSFEVRLPGA